MHHDFTIRNSCSARIHFNWVDNGYDKRIGSRYTESAYIDPGRSLQRTVGCVSVRPRIRWCAEFVDAALKQRDGVCPEYIPAPDREVVEAVAREGPKLTRDGRRLIQKTLAALGFDPGAADGVFGPRTRTAVRAWQVANGYAATGHLTSEETRILQTAQLLNDDLDPSARDSSGNTPLPDAQETGLRLFAAYALALRAAGVEGAAAATKVLADMPGAGMVGAEESLPILWSPFFENAIVKLGRLQSPAPVALYYNPLLDVALFTLWEKREGQYHVVSIRALPGERLADPGADVSPRPPWMLAEDGPIEALALTAAARLDAFRHAHPTKAQDAGHDGATFAAAAADMRAALPRLAWNAARRAQWAAETEPWLRPALTGIEEALAAHDAAALALAAPDTDADTANTLARLPAGFSARLTLDMVLAAGGRERLLIGSLPEDGDIYVFVLCRLDGGACGLRRFVLVSLLG